MNFEEHEDIQYENLEETVIYLKYKKLDINDVLLFDKFIILKNFLKKQNSTYFQQSSNKFCNFFNSCNYIFVYFDLLKTAQFLFVFLPILQMLNPFFVN